MKTYGIYIAYRPSVDLRKEGLGRYLAAFVSEGVRKTNNIKFVIAAPSWCREMIADLFQEEGCLPDSVRLLTPAAIPLLVRLYAYLQRRKRIGVSRPSLREALRLWKYSTLVRCKTALQWRRSPYLKLPSLLGLNIAVAANFALFTVLTLLLEILALPQRAAEFVLYRSFEFTYNRELKKLHGLIERERQVSAWLSLTAFWPSFNRIAGPRVMCVPDVVLMDFPVGFAVCGGLRQVDQFRDVLRAATECDNLVCYSDTIKQHTLVNKLRIPEHRITVIPHAPSRLNTLRPRVHAGQWGQIVSDVISKRFNQPSCVSPQKQRAPAPFLFYASQFRPSKNVLTLLRAFLFLKRVVGLPHMLLLTGRTGMLPAVDEFIGQRFHSGEVVLVSGLSKTELAACYTEAELAVNPTLSEGGCPFTFTEALSVGTPVVMSRIPVAEEVLWDAELQETTFFDPYDWKDVAKRIEWALTHRDELLSIQQPVYKRLAQRTWEHVVREHLEVMDRIACDVSC